MTNERMRWRTSLSGNEVRGAMQKTVLASLHRFGTPAILLRGGIVGVNFAILMGLTALMGLAAFGHMILLWGAAFVLAGVLSLGGPLLFLQKASGAVRIGWRNVAFYSVIGPGLLAIGGAAVAMMVMPAWPWWSVFAVAFMVNLSSGIASLTRNAGSVHLSMLLRDTAPFLALGVAGGLGHADVAGLLNNAAMILGIFCTACLGWLWAHASKHQKLGVHDRILPLPWSLWGTSVLGMALAQIDIVIAGTYLSDDKVGLYALLRRVTNVVLLPMSAATWIAAVPIAGAFNARNHAALIQAIRKSTEIAMLPGSLFIFAASVLAVYAGQAGYSEARPAFVLLLIGAAGQLFFATATTAATMCAQAQWAVATRLGSIVMFVALVWLWPAPGLTGTALAYAVSVVAGNAVLWAVVYFRLGCDSSGFCLLRRSEAVAWKPS